jgi:energy-coupling factor transporter ATP-binding protein EcfA2
VAPKPVHPDGLADLRLSDAPEGAQIRVSLSHRWAIVGTTGSGKTTFARLLVQQLRALWPHLSLYVLDTKDAGDFAHWPGVVTGDAAPQALRGPGVQVWRPDLGDITQFDEWFRRILRSHDRTRPALVFVDELSSIAPNRERYPAGFAMLLKQGRGKAISLVTLTQNAVNIPRDVLAATTHVVRFRLQNDSDARRIDGQLWRDSRPHEPEAAHGFFYKRLDVPSDAPLTFADARKLFARS